MCKAIPYRRDLTERDLERMKIPEKYWNVKLDEITNVAGESGIPPREMVRRYLVNLEEMRSNGGGFVFYGANGTGKTSACVYIGKEYRRRGYTVLFLEAADLKELVVERHQFDEDETWWDRAKGVDVLLLDDLGKDTSDSQGFGAGLVDKLLRARNARNRVTFITCNLPPSKWEEELGLRVSTFHVLKECMIPIRVVGDDKRAPTAGMLRSILLNC